jgi:hypothetical protein
MKILILPQSLHIRIGVQGQSQLSTLHKFDKMEIRVQELVLVEEDQSLEQKKLIIFGPLSNLTHRQRIIKVRNLF